MLVIYVAFIITLLPFVSPFLTKMTKDGYQLDVEILPSSSSSRLTYRYRCTQNGHPLTYGQFLTLLSEPLSSVSGNQFRRIFIDTIRNFPADAFFFECTPITALEVDNKPFEFVILESKELATITIDVAPFKEKFSHLDKNQQVTSFKNLGGDSLLVVPCPIYINSDTKKPDQLYAHIASFVRKSSRIQIDNVLIKCGEELKKVLSERSPNEKIYFSTSGLGVSYLHLRIDNLPKYYQYSAYKK